ncbi:Dihydrolipoamide acetyltransferase component of pyruvate dehydrogenase complex [Candidatus Phytoplasma rubi]|uniref:Dihydrolipoamide acetyltransferase component of pyruvate dehydrogenase complex n=1 Tax=Candidatus Phytoplasma rubi TaxID=399025 RepID=A0ABY7BS41_9MOLU|nr:dihydrolipoamide acetyltransferase family protein [Candidatus Phytoplasma rubi]WAN63334.1 Dihydrolipoamide acetyltransferase component of pyruvate dehydrogenase complex [Candidatus Phytoplasma rubi]
MENNKNKNDKNLNNEDTNQEVEIVKISKIREIIAKKMVIAKTEIPDVTLTEEVDVTDLVLLRKKLKDELESQGIKITYMAFIAKAIIIALKEFPLFNSSFDPEKSEIIIKKNINLGIAIDTPRGLIVPNIKNVDKLNIIDLAQEINKLSQSAKEGKLTLEQVQNGTFTLSNFGTIGGLQCTPIINLPELSILGIGRIVKKPIVKDNNICIADILHLSLSFDHRIIDGADASRFLNRIDLLLSDITELKKFIF